MAKLFFENANCQGATSGATGRNYTADRSGFIHVTDSADIKTLKAGGYMEAGGMPHLSRYWECECGWQSAINSCPKCQREDLRKVEA